MTFERKILAAFLAAIAALMALGALTWHLTRQSLEAAAFVNHTHQVILSANEVSELLFQGEAALRGYLITGKQSFLEARTTAMTALDKEVSSLNLMTEDNPRQQQRIVELRHELGLREERSRYLIFLYESQGLAAVEKEFGALSIGSGGPRQGLTRIRAVRGAIEDEERELLRKRQSDEAERTASARTGFIGLLVLLALVLPVGYLRVRKDMRERSNAERAMQVSSRYDRSNAAALALFNEETEKTDILRGVMDILAREHDFPCLLFYTYEALGGALRLDVSRGAPAGTQPLHKLGEGLVGEAAFSQRLIEVDDADLTMAQLPVDTGFGQVTPTALLYSPVSYRGNLLGVLAMASTTVVTERDRVFIELVSTQLGAALNNIKQLEDMRLLAEQLRARSEEITQQNRQVEEASRMKSEFLANMSHELRTPLNAIIGFSEVIKDGMAGPITPEQEEYTSDILASGQHLLALINDILDLSKIEAGHMSLDLEPVNIGSVVQSGLSIVAEKALNSQVTLTNSVSDGLDQICLDVRKTKQILYNLLSNAVKFTPSQGRVDLSVRRVSYEEVAACKTQPGLRVFPVREDQHEWFMEMRVTDSGIGISAEGLDRLFEPFTQIDSSHSRKYEGTGLGLAMVRRLAELHGGGAMARSEPGRGSTFTVWLPLRLDNEAPSPILITQAARAMPGYVSEIMQLRAGNALPPLLLLVEDEPEAAKLFRIQLENEGYRVAHAVSAEAGMRMAMELNPDAVVLDVILPGMDGWQMLNLLKQSPATSHIPVVIVSITPDASRSFALGASQVLSKPVSQDDLMAALAALGLDLGFGQQVLVADDDPMSVSLVSVHLKAAGFDPLGAYGGKEAIELAISKKPALMVLDLMMPDMNGFEVVQAMAATPHTADIPIIILTSKQLTTEERAMLDGKVRRVMEKASFDPKVFHSEVKRALVMHLKKSSVN